MAVSDWIKLYFPLTDPSAKALIALDAVGNHIQEEIDHIVDTYVQLGPVVQSPTTPIGDNYEKVLEIIDNLELADYNPFREDNILSYYFLTDMIDILEANLESLISYYSTVVSSPPPTGYPQSPVPLPIPSIIPSAIPLLKPTLILKFTTTIQSNINNIDNLTTITPEINTFVSALSDYFMLEAFLI